MPKRIVLETVKVMRDNKPVVPKIGQPFDFTAKELDEINAVRPQAVRKIVVEDPEAAAALEAKQEAAEANEQAAKEQAAKEAAKKPAAKKPAAATAAAGDDESL